MIAKNLQFRAIVALLAVWAAPSHGMAQRTDVLTLGNGDVITGEVRELEQGYLSYKTDNAGTLSVKWIHITNLRSVNTFEVELTSGALLYGPLEDPEPGSLRVGEQVVPLYSVVTIVPIEANFWARTSGHVDVGLDLAKADNRYNISFDSDVTYRSRKWGGSTGAQYYEQNQKDADRFRNASISLEGFRYFGTVLTERKVPVWSGRVFWEASTNDQLSLDLRNVVGLGAQRRIWHTNGGEASASVAVVESRETYSGEEEPYHSIEALLTSVFEIFRVDSPKLNLSMDPKVYIGLTNAGRVRGTLDARVQYEVFRDFYVGLTGNLSLDSEPQSKNKTSKSDYTLNFTLGWSWW